MTADELVREFMKTMDEAREAAHRSVLDGTVSCRVCRVLVLESNAPGHYKWHYDGQHVDLEEARWGMEL